MKSCKPGIYKNIVGEGEEKDLGELVERSFEFQRKLASSKSDFANTLLYKMIVSGVDIPDLPTYMKDGLKWLSNKLNTSLSLKGGGKDVSE